MEAVLNLETLKVPQLTALLKDKGLPVSGCKDWLLKRVRSPPMGPKLKAWQHSEAKKTLRKALLDPKSIIRKMSIEEVKNSDPSFKQYPNFEKYHRDLKETFEEQRVQAREDDLETAMHLLSFQRAILAKKDICTGMGTQYRHCFKWMSRKDVTGHKHLPNFNRARWNTQCFLLQCFGSESIEKIPSKS